MSRTLLILKWNMLNATILRVAFALALLPADVGLASGQEQASVTATTPVVVELFTSQGCDACPAANDLLGEIAARPDVIALSFHVGYWDYAGWADVLAIPAATSRQQAYRRTLRMHLLYTPQFVVDGVMDLQAPTRADVDSAVDEMARRDAKIPLAFSLREGAALRVSLPAVVTDVSAKIWLVLFDRHAETLVTAGDNAGRVVRSVNVVRDLIPVGDWHGDAIEVPLDVGGYGLSRYDGCAVLVQTEPTGRILGAAVLRPDRMEGP